MKKTVSEGIPLKPLKPIQTKSQIKKPKRDIQRRALSSVKIQAEKQPPPDEDIIIPQSLYVKINKTELKTKSPDRINNLDKMIGLEYHRNNNLSDKYIFIILVNIILMKEIY